MNYSDEKSNTDHYDIQHHYKFPQSQGHRGKKKPEKNGRNRKLKLGKVVIHRKPAVF